MGFLNVRAAGVVRVSSMKKTVLLASLVSLGLLLMGTAVSFAWRFASGVSEQTEVNRVCVALVDAKNRYREEISDYRRRTDPTANYIRSIRDINLARCPSTFRQSVLSYTHQVEKAEPNPRELVRLLADPKKTLERWFGDSPVTDSWNGREPKSPGQRAPAPCR